MQATRRFWWMVSVLSIASLGVGLGAAGGEGTLIEAVKKGDNSAVRAWIRSHSDVNAPEADGTTALHWAVHRDDLETVDLLLAAGANVRAANRYKIMPLSLACINGNAALIERLLKAGADPN